MNFKNELIEVLKAYNKTIDDIVWVGYDDGEIDLKSFLDNIDFEYDNGYGGISISLGLMVVGNDWWLERYEYDGSEWWDFKKYPKRPEKIKYSHRIRYE